MSAGDVTIPDPDPESAAEEATSPGDEVMRFERDDLSSSLLTPHRQRHRLHTPESWALALVDYMLTQFEPDSTTSVGAGQSNLTLILFRLEDGTLRLWLQRDSDKADIGPRLTIEPKP